MITVNSQKATLQQTAVSDLGRFNTIADHIQAGLANGFPAQLAAKIAAVSAADYRAALVAISSETAISAIESAFKALQAIPAA